MSTFLQVSSDMQRAMNIKKMATAVLVFGLAISEKLVTRVSEKTRSLVRSSFKSAENGELGIWDLHLLFKLITNQKGQH